MKYIVTTTIFQPSEALVKFSNMKDWKLVIAGDLKTPHEEYKKLDCIYLDPSEQEKLYPILSKLIGWNSIQRRNIALLHAYNLGAELVALVDDDNIPLDNWGKDILIGKEVECKVYTPKVVPVFDPLSVTNYRHLWHRGFPIQYLNKKNELECKIDKIIPDIQADFWNGDPDVDAICRIEHSPECEFNEDVFPFASTKISPFNSQNTFMSRKVVPDFLCLTHVGRMDDIWGSYYCQSKGHKVIYNKPTVYQKRNNHDLTKDFQGEVLGYLDTYKLVENPGDIQKFICKESHEVMSEYFKSFH